MNRLFCLSLTLLISSVLLAQNKVSKVKSQTKRKPASCEAKTYAHPLIRFYHYSGTGTYWLSLSDESSQIFLALGLKELESLLPQVKIENMQACPQEADRFTTLTSFNSRLTSRVYNACQQERLKKLGFAIKELETYGSMEAGVGLQWAQIGICTNGKEIFHCDTKEDMQLCLNTILGPNRDLKKK